MEKKKYGFNEEFRTKDGSIGLTVLDFWQYMYSDLNSDPRTDVAEFLVSTALGLKESTNRQYWTLYDIFYKERRIGVKSTGYYQTWREDGKVSNTRSFSIRKATDRKTGIYERHNDVYVFCLLNGNARETANPLVLENWDFYVVPTSVINNKCNDNHSISLSKIKKLGYERVSYDDLKSSIDTVIGLIAMKEVLKNCDETKINFICRECSVTATELEAMDVEQVYDIVYETMCNIEIEEVCARTVYEDDSERCKTASDIVTIMGNELAKAEEFSEEDME